MDKVNSESSVVKKKKNYQRKKKSATVNKSKSNQVVNKKVRSQQSKASKFDERKKKESVNSEEVKQDIKLEEKQDQKMIDPAVLGILDEVEEVVNKVKESTEVYEFTNAFKIKDNEKYLSFLYRLKSPIESIERRYENINFKPISVFFRLLLKNGLACLCIVFLLSDIINYNIFSFAQMTFSSASWLWLRLTLCISILEVMTVCILSVQGKSLSSFFENFKTLITVSSERTFLISALFFVVSIFTRFEKFFAIALFMAVMILDSFLFMYSYRKVRRVSYFRASCMISLCFFIDVLLLQSFVKLFCHDIVRIFMVIFE